jgi:sialate O-acetylesterase
MKQRLSAAVATALAAFSSSAAAPEAPPDEFSLPPVFSDHMVLQQGVPVPVWGEGPNMAWRLSCRVGDVVTWAHADIGQPRGPGRWAVKFYLPPLKAGGPYEMVLSNEHSHATHVIRDVWVGEVWLASGQSNMAWTMKTTGNALGAPGIAGLRLFDGKRWAVATTNSVKGMSAVATFFGRELQRELGTAVGVLSLSGGGTLAENWMSRSALKRCPATRAWTAEYECRQGDPEAWAEEPRRPKENALDPGPAAETEDWAKPGFAAADWVKTDQPGTFTSSFGRPFNGAAWFRRTLDLPASWAGRDLVLKLPAVDKHDVVWFNGEEVGRTGQGEEWEMWNVKRVYAVPGRLVMAGRNTVAIRIWSYAYGAGFTTGADHFSVGPKDAADAISLEGEWLGKIERDIGNRGDDIRPKRRSYPEGPTTVKPSSWYERALLPVIPYPLKGAVWYQGESNAVDVESARAYRETLAALIDDWRYQWGLGDFPFGIVQLANFAHVRRHVADCPWAELRESQLAVSRAVKNTGIACAIDLGDEYTIHPTNKLDVAKRLCRWAMVDVYGRRSGPATGPRFLSGAVEKDGRVRLRFTEAAGGLIATGPVTGAVIRGADGVWLSADVAIDGETLLVSSAAVHDPVEIRYAWAQNPIGATLRGKASDLPVFPFRWRR